MRTFLIAALLAALLPQGCAAGTKSFYGVTAEVPDGWEFSQGEQVIIYCDGAESGAVVVDCIDGEKAQGGAQGAAENLARTVGVDEDAIRSDEDGTLSIDFEQDGEPVNVGVIGVGDDVLMVYTYGKNPEGRKISSSIKPQK